MKKTKFLAALLCVMMVFSVMPYTFATEDGTTGYDSLEDIVGEVTPVFDFQFKAGFTEDQGYLHSNTGNITYTDENGIEFSTGGVWRFTEGDNTTPMSHGAVGFTVQLLNDGNSVTFQVNKADNSGRVYFVIKGNAITTNEKKVYDGEFQPWYKDAEYVVKDEGANYSVYAKSDAYTEGKWILAFTAPYEIGKSVGQGLRFDANSGYLKNFKVYQETFESIKEIVGGDVATAYDFDFKEDFDGTMKFTESWSAGFETPEGATYTDDKGLTLPANSQAGSGTRWLFRPYGKDNPPWSPLSSGGKRHAVAFSMALPETGTITMYMGSPNGYGDLTITFTAGTGFTAAPASASSVVATALPANEFVDYLLVPKDLGGGDVDTTDGWTFYMKHDTLTGGKWFKMIDSVRYANTTKTYYSQGLQFYGPNASIKNLKILSIEDVVANDATIPDGADFLYYNEDFTVKPTYLSADGGNLSVGGVTFDTANDGYAVLQQTEQSGYPSYYLDKAGIPVGGYAEIKVRAGARMNFSLPTPDATQRIKLDMRKEKGTINDTSVVFIGDGGNTWWTYRILCNSDNTYDVYVKAEGDTAWLQLANDIAAMAPAGSGPDRIAINQYEHVAGASYEDYSSSIDYIKIYGAAPTADLTLFDGYGTTAVAGNTLAYPGALHAIVNSADGQLLVAKYNADDVLIGVQIVEPSELDEQNSILINAYDADCVKVKAFFWKGGANGNLVNINEALELTYA